MSHSLRAYTATATMMGALFFPPLAAGEEGPRMRLGLTAGLAFPQGEISHLRGALKQQEVIGTGVMLGAEGTWRFHPHWSAALHGEWVNGGPGTSCPARGAGCAQRLWRAGALARLHVLGDEKAYDLWVGVGAGLRSLHYTRTAPPIYETSWDGLEVATVSVGADLWVTPRLALSPFAQVTGSLYLVNSAAGVSTSTPVLYPAMNPTYSVGMRGVIALDKPRKIHWAPELQTPHPAAQMFDEAHASLEQATRLVERGRLALARDRARDALALTARARDFLASPRAEVREEYYTHSEGGLTRDALMERLTALERRAHSVLEALHAAEASEGG